MKLLTAVLFFLCGTLLATDPVLWHKIDNVNDDSMIGPNPTIIQDSTMAYDITKFSNGLRGYGQTGYTRNFMYFTKPLGKKFSISYHIKIAMASMADNYTVYFGTLPYFYLTITSASSGGVAIYTAGGDTFYYFNPGAYVTGDVIHWAFVFDTDAGAGNRIKIYRNGTNRTINSTPSDTGWATNNLNIAIGGLRSPYSTGYIDNLKVYDHAMSADEILWDRYNEGLEVTTTPVSRKPRPRYRISN